MDFRRYWKDRGSMRFACVGATLFLVMGAAQAEQVPAFDFAAYCAFQGAQTARGGMEFSNCLTVEQQTFHELLASYRYVADAVARACERKVRKATGGHGSYAALNACLLKQPR